MGARLLHISTFARMLYFMFWAQLTCLYVVLFVSIFAANMWMNLKYVAVDDWIAFNLVKDDLLHTAIWVWLKLYNSIFSKEWADILGYWTGTSLTVGWKDSGLKILPWSKLEELSWGLISQYWQWQFLRLAYNTIEIIRSSQKGICGWFQAKTCICTLTFDAVTSSTIAH